MFLFGNKKWKGFFCIVDNKRLFESALVGHINKPESAKHVSLLLLLQFDVEICWLFQFNNA